MTLITEVGRLPKSPAIYALCGGQGRHIYIAYVGMADDLRRRIVQHLVTRDSSIATRASAVGLNSDLVTQVRWWEHERFAARTSLEAAELVAFECLNPALRSRGGISKQAAVLSRRQSFKDEMALLFDSHPTGRLLLPNIEAAMRRISALEEQVSALIDATRRKLNQETSR